MKATGVVGTGWHRPNDRHMPDGAVMAALAYTNPAYLSGA